MTGLSVVTLLLNLYAENIKRNARLDELQAGIKIGGRNINNLTYADGATLLTESKEELKSLLIRVEEESERAGLELNVKNKTKQTNKDHGTQSHHFMANRGRKGGRKLSS